MRMTAHGVGYRTKVEIEGDQLGRLRLEVVVEAEPVTVGGGLLVLGVLLGAGHDTGLLVVANTLLEEVGLAGQGDGLHEVEGVGRVVVLLVAEGDQEAVGNKLDVLAHQLGVHAQEGNGQSISQELLLNADGLDNDVLDQLLAGAVVQVREQQTSEVSVQTLVTRDQLVGEGQTGHQTTLLQPEDGGKRAREENTLDGSKSNQTRGEGGLLVLDPLDSPVGLASNAGDCS